MGPVRVTIVKHGTLAILSGEPWDRSGRAYRERTDLGVHGGSNVVLVRGSDYRLLVDTGFEYEADASEENRRANARRLRWHLRQHGLRPADITHVFLTHAHFDHVGNLPLFPAARRHMLDAAACTMFAREVVGVPDGDELLPGVRVVATPGHTRHHASLIVDDRIAIAGDAIVDYSYFRDDAVWSFNTDFFSLEAARETMRRLTERAEVIVPGHGGPFRT
jgi:glyoxylase-like metal-dependent hydrolase (beta-lactamase superfamily II)